MHLYMKSCNSKNPRILSKPALGNFTTNIQGYRDRTMTKKLMYIPNDDSQNCPFCRLQLVVETLDTKLNKLTNHNSLKPLKLLSQRIRKYYHKTLGTSVISCLLSTISLNFTTADQVNMDRTQNDNLSFPHYFV